MPTAMLMVVFHLAAQNIAGWASTRKNAVDIYHVYLWFMVLPGSPLFCKVGVYQELSGGHLPSHCGRHPPCSPKFCKVDAHRNAHGSRPPCSLKSCRVDVYHKHCNCGGRLPLDPWWAAQNIAGWASTTHFAVDVYRSVLGRQPPCRFLGCKVDIYHDLCGGRLPRTLWWTSTITSLVDTHLVAQSPARWASTKKNVVGIYRSLLGRQPPCRFSCCKVDVYHELCGGRLP